jgi:UDP-GlcNAc:undecaprenyl-phosphate/decaprenyl-phosphate GlcNAc-1-phosphate transferase
MESSILIVLAGFVIIAGSYFLSKYNILIAKKLGLIDHPDSDRKFHDSPIPLSGINLSIILALGLSTVIFYWREIGLGDYFQLTKNPENIVDWWWIVAGIAVILVGGFLDDKFRLKTWQLAIPINIALLLIVLGGNLQIKAFSYPFDAILPNITFLHSFLAWVWLGLCLSTTKFLDGHDGLVTSVGIVNLSVIAVVAALPGIDQPLVWGICLVWIASLLGFLPFNLPKARSYIGEAGSEIVGLMIGVLSILSGAKLATSFSIVGWFLLDLVLVFAIRIRNGKSPLAAGREHWHFRLLDYGFSRWQVLGISLSLITFTGIFGAFLPTVYKPFIILFEAVVLGVIFGITSRKK